MEIPVVFFFSFFMFVLREIALNFSIFVLCQNLVSVLYSFYKNNLEAILISLCSGRFKFHLLLEYLKELSFETIWIWCFCRRFSFLQTFSVSSLLLVYLGFPSLMELILIIYNSWKISYFTNLFTLFPLNFLQNLFFSFLLDLWYFLLIVSNVVCSATEIYQFYHVFPHINYLNLSALPFLCSNSLISFFSNFLGFI